jgi:hypothetical protein
MHLPNVQHTIAKEVETYLPLSQSCQTRNKGSKITALWHLQQLSKGILGQCCPLARANSSLCCTELGNTLCKASRSSRNKLFEEQNLEPRLPKLVLAEREQAAPASSPTTVNKCPCMLPLLQTGIEIVIIASLDAHTLQCHAKCCMQSSFTIW